LQKRHMHAFSALFSRAFPKKVVFFSFSLDFSREPNRISSTNTPVSHLTSYLSTKPYRSYLPLLISENRTLTTACFSSER
jgi:hypothetical protein